MDIQKNIERVKAMLLETCCGNINEGIVVCEKIIEQFKQQSINSQGSNNSNMRNGYKVVRFKKPILPIEERRVYHRVCRRCDELYCTFHKFSWFCNKCKLKGITDEVSKK